MCMVDKKNRLPTEIEELTIHLKQDMESSDFISESLPLCQSLVDADAASVFGVKHNPVTHEFYLQLLDCIGYEKIKGNKESGKKVEFPGVRYNLTGDEPIGLTANIVLESKACLINSQEMLDEQKKTRNFKGTFRNVAWRKPDSPRSFIGVPIISAGSCLGVLRIDRKDWDSLNDVDLKNVEVFASIIGSGLGSILFSKRLGDATSILAASSQVIETLQKIVRECAHVTSAEACSLFLLDEDAENQLILRADNGHDYNLSNQKGKNNKFVYDGDRTGEKKPGITWECFESAEPREANNKDEVTDPDSHADKLWPDQWDVDKKKKCHSYFMDCVKECSSTGEAIEKFGVLKVENKLGYDKIPIENGGFNNQDKQVVEIFANAVALLLRTKDVTFGKSYTCSQMFGEPIIKALSEDSFIRSLKLLSHGDKIVEYLEEFIDTIVSDRGAWRSIIEYSDIVLRICRNMGSTLTLDKIASELLKGLQDYEFALKNIPAYRYHFTHVFNVFLLGLLIICKNKGIREKFKGNQKNALIQEWFIVAMLHDIGLPIEKSDKLFSILMQQSLHLDNDIKFPFSQMPILSIQDFFDEFPLFVDLVAKSLECSKGSIKYKILKTVLHQMSFPTTEKTLKTHSLMSAMMVYRYLKNDKIIKSLPNILSAIVFHEIDVVSKIQRECNKFDNAKELREFFASQMSLSKNPLMFLLALCDTFQNWGRPENMGFVAGSIIDESDNVEVFKFDIDDSNISLTLSYEEEPKSWDNIRNNIILPQTLAWRLDDERVIINMMFINKKGREFGRIPWLRDSSHEKE